MPRDRFSEMRFVGFFFCAFFLWWHAKAGGGLHTAFFLGFMVSRWWGLGEDLDGPRSAVRYGCSRIPEPPHPHRFDPRPVELVSLTCP